MNNLSGRKFGKLLAVEDAGRRDGKVLWFCTCDCGNNCLVVSTKLVQGVTKSCGKCSNNKHDYTSKYGYGFSQTFKNYYINARRRNIEWDLNPDQAHALFVSNCFYCDAPPSNVIDGKHKIPFFYNGIDRVDSEKSYSLANCVACCSRCNYAKGRKTYEDFICLIKEVYEHHVINKVKH